MQYLYSDGELYYFMDNENYEQMPLNANKLPDSFKFVKENTIVKILSYKGNVYSIEPPFFVDLKVVETEPAVRGDTSNNATKSATLETGAVIKVPLFIGIDEIIRIDTRNGEYMERA
jgi:elongation factor P